MNGFNLTLIFVAIVIILFLLFKLTIHIQRLFFCKMPKINVKFGSKTLSVDADLNEPPFLLKAQLFELTEVPPERQKLLIKVKI